MAGKKRICGPDGWELFDASEELKSEKEKYDRLLRSVAKEERIYADQIKNVEDAVVVDDDTFICERCGMHNGKLSRLSDEARDKIVNSPEYSNLKLAVKKIDDLQKKKGKKYGVHPGAIEPQTGQILEDDMEVAVPILTETKSEE